MTLEAIIMVGIPASGKSSFYNTHFQNSHMRISNDLLKTKSRERKLLGFCFDTKINVCIDNTCVTREVRSTYINLLKEAGYTITCFYFVPDVGRSLSWNKKRIGKDCLPKVAIFAKKKALEVPTLDEGFDSLFSVVLVDKKLEIKC